MFNKPEKLLFVWYIVALTKRKPTSVKIERKGIGSIIKLRHNDESAQSASSELGIPHTQTFS